MQFDDYLKAILIPFLKEPEALEIETTQDNMGVLFSVRVHKTDMGCVVGKDGEMAKSIRHLIRVYGAKNQARLSVKFIEPVGGKYPIL